MFPTLYQCVKRAKSTGALNRNIPKHRGLTFGERLKLVNTDLLGYAYMAKYTDHHSRVKSSSFIEEPSSVLPTAELATSQTIARQLALQRQGSMKQQLYTVSQYTRVVGIDINNRLVSIRYQHLRATYGLTKSGKMQTFNDLCSKINEFSTENFF